MVTVEDIKNNTVTRVPQPKLGSYFIARKEGDEIIDWNGNSRDVFNFVRAITNPGPQARSKVQRPKFETLVKIKQVEIIQDFVWVCFYQIA